MVAALTVAQVLSLASVYHDWDPQWVAWQVFDAGTGHGESSGRPDIVSANGKYVGLLQIDWKLHGLTIAQLQDPATNIAEGYKLFLQSGTAPWPSAKNYPGIQRTVTMIAPDFVSLSPNVNDAPMPASCKTVIIHATRSGTSMNPTEFQGTLNYMATPNTTSSHWVISRDGRAARVVNDNRQAWHASEDNDNAWGIELEQGVETDGFTVAQIDKLVAVCRGYVADFGVTATHAATSAGPGFIGHQETAQGKSYGKTDPGRLFQWENFIARLNGGQSSAPIGQLEADDMFTVLSNGGKVSAQAAADYTFDLKAIGLPASAKRCRLQVWNNGPPLELYHGLPDTNNRDAGRVYQPYSIIEVVPSQDGKCYIGPPGALFDIQVLGYFS